MKIYSFSLEANGYDFFESYPDYDTSYTKTLFKKAYLEILYDFSHFIDSEAIIVNYDIENLLWCILALYFL